MESPCGTCGARLLRHARQSAGDRQYHQSMSIEWLQRELQLRRAYDNNGPPTLLVSIIGSCPRGQREGKRQRRRAECSRSTLVSARAKTKKTRMHTLLVHTMPSPTIRDPLLSVWGFPEVLFCFLPSTKRRFNCSPGHLLTRYFLDLPHCLYCPSTVCCCGLLAIGDFVSDQRLGRLLAAAGWQGGYP